MNKTFWILSILLVLLLSGCSATGHKTKQCHDMKSSKCPYMQNKEKCCDKSPEHKKCGCNKHKEDKAGKCCGK